ncbi:MAG: cell division protein ZapA [Bacteroidales bacterium]|jgi:cell division protein ZapA (FtsZ GTPase activity inhibitor)|nr:cell division protein ZapA [Bacteroidales bacterium]
METISITVTISDRPYKLKVKREDEVIFREAAVKINEQIGNYAQNYAFKDQQDLLSMVALQYAFNALKNEQIIRFRDNELTEKLHALDRLLTV